MKIRKNSYLTKAITKTAIFTITILFLIVSLIDLHFGRNIENSIFVENFLIIVIWALFCSLVCFIIMKFHKTYYIINNSQIKKIKNDIELFVINKNQIWFIEYDKYGFIRMLIGHIFYSTPSYGTGFMYIRYETLEQKNNPARTSLSDLKEYQISMSFKQAKEISKLLNKDIKFL